MNNDAYPKPPHDIWVRVLYQEINQNSGSVDSAAMTRATLGNKLMEYLINLGQSNVFLQHIVVELMTKTKVVVGFGNYNERIELLDPQDKLTAAQAVTLWDDFIAEVAKGKKTQLSDDMNRTQKIMVRPPPSRPNG